MWGACEGLTSKRRKWSHRCCHLTWGRAQYCTKAGGCWKLLNTWSRPRHSKQCACGSVLAMRLGQAGHAQGCCGDFMRRKNKTVGKLANLWRKKKDSWLQFHSLIYVGASPYSSRLNLMADYIHANFNGQIRDWSLCEIEPWTYSCISPYEINWNILLCGIFLCIWCTFKRKFPPECKWSWILTLLFGLLWNQQ